MEAAQAGLAQRFGELRRLVQVKIRHASIYLLYPQVWVGIVIQGTRGFLNFLRSGSKAKLLHQQADADSKARNLTSSRGWMMLVAFGEIFRAFCLCSPFFPTMVSLGPKKRPHTWMSCQLPQHFQLKLRRPIQFADSGGEDKSGEPEQEPTGHLACGNPKSFEAIPVPLACIGSLRFCPLFAETPSPS